MEMQHSSELHGPPLSSPLLSILSFFVPPSSYENIAQPSSTVTHRRGYYSPSVLPPARVLHVWGISVPPCSFVWFFTFCPPPPPTAQPCLCFHPLEPWSALHRRCLPSLFQGTSCSRWLRSTDRSRCSWRRWLVFRAGEWGFCRHADLAPQHSSGSLDAAAVLLITPRLPARAAATRVVPRGGRGGGGVAC